LLTIAGASSPGPAWAPAAVASNGCLIVGALQMKAVIGALILATIPLSGLFIVTERYPGAVSAQTDLGTRLSDIGASRPIRWERVKVLSARANGYSGRDLFTGPLITSAILP